MEINKLSNLWLAGYQAIENRIKQRHNANLSDKNARKEPTFQERLDWIEQNNPEYE